MANSRSLLVYVLALVLVVCGRSWVAANTVPIARDLPSATPGGLSLQAQPHLHQQHKHHHPKHEATQQLSQQQNPEPSSSALSAQPASLALPSGQQQKLRNDNGPTTLSLKNGWAINAGNSQTGPYTSGYGYITGRTLNQPSSTYMTDYDLPEMRPGAGTPMGDPGTTFGAIATHMPPLLNNGVDTMSLFMGMLLGGLGTYAGLPGRMAGLLPSFRGLFSSSDEENETKDSSTSEKSSRRKRNVVEDTTDLTELANIVLSAIQSGDCMQRSICLMGSRIGNSSKGRVAFTLMDTLIPESVQTNQYFVTMKKALKGGESFCDRFRCRLN